MLLSCSDSVDLCLTPTRLNPDDESEEGEKVGEVMTIESEGLEIPVDMGMLTEGALVIGALDCQVKAG